MGYKNSGGWGGVGGGGGGLVASLSSTSTLQIFDLLLPFIIL